MEVCSTDTSYIQQGTIDVDELVDTLLEREWLLWHANAVN